MRLKRVSCAKCGEVIAVTDARPTVLPGIYQCRDGCHPITEAAFLRKQADDAMKSLFALPLKTKEARHAREKLSDQIEMVFSRLFDLVKDHPQDKVLS